MDERISLGIDLGTSELKAVLMDLQGASIGQAGASLSTLRPQPGWAEQDPEIWWQTCVAVLGKLRVAFPDAYARISTIGLSGQMHGAVLINRADICIRSAILWNDSRSSRQAAHLAEAYPSFAAITGSTAMAGFTAPKLLWLKQNEANIFTATDCVLSPKDYIRLRLTGERITDVSDAAGTLWLDINARNWFAPMVEATGLSLNQLPRLVEGTAVAGQVRATVARALGLAHSVIVAGGGGDGPVSGVGIGAVESGDSFITLGTSAAIIHVADKPLGDPGAAVHSLCHAVPDRWYAMGAILSGASCLTWASRLLLQANEQALLEHTETSIPTGSIVTPDAALFLPYLSGERTPHNDPLARGGFVNLSHSTDTAALGYAVLEGVGFALLDALKSVESAGARVSRCSLVGGGSRSTYWAQLLSNILERELVTYQESALGTSIGAGKLGFAALGHGCLLHQRPPSKAVFRPDPAPTRALAARYDKFRALFPAIRRLHG